MVKLYFKQAWELMKQNKLYSFITILITAITIAFVMVAYMAYDLGSNNFSPEIHRTRSLYISKVQSYRTADHGNQSSNMSYRTARALTDSLSLAALVSIHCANRPYTVEALGGDNTRERRRGRFVDHNWWTLFDYEFISGRPFTEEEYQSGRKVVVISEMLAGALFQSTEDAVGREIAVNFIPYVVCGVVRNVSRQFSVAYADLWINYTAYPDIKEFGTGSERVAGATHFIALAKPNKVNALKKELETRLDMFNKSLLETTFQAKFKSHVEYTFADIFGIPPALIYALLIAVFILIPAINISGLIASMLEKRYEEIAIRKAYGAPNYAIIKRFLFENLSQVVVGGLLGLLLSIACIYFLSDWLLGTSTASANELLRMCVRADVFLVTLVFCLLFNLLSIFFPVWHVSRKSIIDTIHSK